jgi:hypothetical protein
MEGKDHFLAVLSNNSDIYLFDFRRILFPGGEKYFITIQGAETSFEMKKDRFGKWRIIQPAPAKFLCLEEQLSEEIERHK